MREIGGYLELEEFAHKEYYPDFVAVNNARCGLLYILKAKQIKKLYIPYYLCDSVSNMLDREDFAYEYYHIDENFQPIFNKALAKGEYLYVVNYYGQITNETDLKQKYGNIILDNVQAFFQKPVAGIDTVYSCRKFFGVPDGGYVATETRLDEDLPVDISKDRMAHILGRYEGTASDYYADFKNSDDSFETIELRAMSNLTRNLLGAVDYEKVKQKREKNFAFLHEVLSRYNKLSLKSPVAPYAYPFYCVGGVNVRRELAKYKIYVATLWPNVVSFDNGDCALEKDYAENILPLPCDQRYGREDMERIMNILQRNGVFGNEY